MFYTDIEVDNALDNHAGREIQFSEMELAGFGSAFVLIARDRDII